MGRPHKPLVLKQLNGSHRGKYGFDTKAMDPEPPKGDLLLPPTWLSPKASETWMQMVRELRELGMLKTTDLHALASYCDSWAEYLLLCQDCRHEDYTTNGKVNPLYTIRDMAFKRWVKMASEFGMTPAARMRVQMVAVTQGTNTKSKFFAQ
jgi:P27 family predicted phage terminase small subunit